jgi:esterase/lipase
MSIFAKPNQATEFDGNLKVLFLHGLEGSPEGQKAVFLKKKWNASVPHLRTGPLRELKSSHANVSWKDLPARDLKKAVDVVYKDALSAMNYVNPDVIIGSSMGGALLARLVIEEKWKGPRIFLAPAIDHFLKDVNLPEMKSAMWILGETDEVVPNTPNIKHCLNTGGNLIVSPSDDHRLAMATDSGLLDCAITTVIEIDQVNTYL